MSLNVNTSDSPELNQSETPNEKYKGDAQGRQQDGYIIEEKGRRIQKWVDKDGNWKEKVL